MIKRGTAQITFGTNPITTLIVDVVEKTSGNYTEYVIKRTSNIDRDMLGDEVQGEYDMGADTNCTVFNCTLNEMVLILANGYSNYAFEWITPLTEV